MDWKIYYSRYTGPDDLNFYTVSSAEKTWEESPKRGLTVALYADDTWGRRLIYGHELYYKLPGTEILHSESMDALLAHVPAIREDQIKFGGNAFRGIQWTKILQFAINDPDFPIKLTPRRRKTDSSDGSITT